MARKRATITDLLNDLTFKINYEKYKLLACSTYEWEGLPEGIEGRHIEKLLFSDGLACFFRDPEKSYMCLAAQSTGKLNVNGDPVEWRAFGFQYSKVYKSDKCVIIRNNSLGLNTENFVMHYANKLTEAERTMDVNVKACKTPYIFACDGNDVLTFKRIFQQVDGNTPALFVDKNLNLDAITLFNTGVKFLGNELQDYKKSVENEFLTFLGYNNLAVDKKERVNVSEANSNNEVTQSFAELQLAARQLACKQISDLFGLNVTVKRKELNANVGTDTV